MIILGFGLHIGIIPNLAFLKVPLPRTNQGTSSVTNRENKKSDTDSSEAQSPKEVPWMSMTLTL